MLNPFLEILILMENGGTLKIARKTKVYLTSNVAAERYTNNTMQGVYRLYKEGRTMTC